MENHPLPVRGQGKFPGLVVRVLNQYDDEAGKPKEVELERDGKKKKGFPAEEGYPVIHIEKVTFKGPVYDQWPPQRIVTYYLIPKCGKSTSGLMLLM